MSLYIQYSMSFIAAFHFMAPFVVGLGFQAPKLSELGQINSLDGPFSVLTVLYLDSIMSETHYADS